jgi:creatinine amidohydrolase
MTQVAAEIATKKGASILVCPALPFGATSMSMDFAGTISLRTSTLEACLLDICDSLIHHGIKKIAFVEGEGGNTPAVSSVLRHYEDARGPNGPLREVVGA